MPALPVIDGLTDLVEIGRGGFGVVYRAEQEAAGRQVAIKVLLDAMHDERSKGRFAREAAAMGALSGHPNIVQLLQSGYTEKGAPYLVMPFMANGSLGDRLETGPVPWRDVVTMGIKLCGGLESAHDAGVLHRDVKPDNVLFSKYREPLLADFGIARVANHATTKTGSITASVLYAPPEILDGGSPTAVSDVYSLAATLYQALSGTPAFASDTDQSVGPLLVRIMSSLPEDLRDRGVPDPVWQVISAAMAKDPADRPPTARAFGDALRSAQVTLGLSQTAMTVPDARPTADVQPPAPAERSWTGAAPAATPSPSQTSGPHQPYAAQQPYVQPQPYAQPQSYAQQPASPYQTASPQQDAGPYTATNPYAAPNPYGNTGAYVDPYASPAKSIPPIRVALSYIISVMGIVFSPLVGGWGLALAYWGRAKGEPGAKVAIIVAWVCLALSIVLYASIIANS